MSLVLVVPVPELDGYVRERTAHHDASFLGRDPGFVNAHVTLLGPWLPAPGPGDLAAVGRVVATQSAFDVELRELGVFPDGTIHLLPEPRGPFDALTARLLEAFPGCRAYDGRYPELVPHLTLERVGGGVDVETVRAELGGALPARTRVRRVDLQRWANHDCRLLHSWALPEQ